jgi:hypothetical protein
MTHSYYFRKIRISLSALISSLFLSFIALYFIITVLKMQDQSWARAYHVFSSHDNYYPKLQVFTVW